jgi:CO/xanthine dehydrogenase FAD-binding subunit
MKEGLLAPAQVTSLSGIRGLDAIAPTPDGGLRVGPMVTLANLAANAKMGERYPASANAASDSARPQIRNVATIGATSCNGRAVGTSAPPSSAACARGQPLLCDLGRKPISRDL